MMGQEFPSKRQESTRALVSVLADDGPELPQACGRNPCRLMMGQELVQSSDRNPCKKIPRIGGPNLLHILKADTLDSGLSQI